jgi:transcriptional regulator with XRE-family HTH domain
MTSKRIGAILKELRLERGLTQVELAKKAKTVQPYIAYLESGEKKNPSFAVLQRLAKALGVPLADLLE